MTDNVLQHLFLQSMDYEKRVYQVPIQSDANWATLHWNENRNFIISVLADSLSFLYYLSGSDFAHFDLPMKIIQPKIWL